jgi:mycofactocin system transcriptional regulator
MSKAIGRPPATTRDELAQIGLELFAADGFEQTTLDDIARAARVSRRTVLRYYDSKNDIVWGAFDEELEALRARLAAAPRGEPLLTSIRREVIAFNDYGADALPDLQRRMALITTVPALQGHAMLRYEAWSAVIAEFVAGRIGVALDAFAPQLVASLALGVAVTAYRHWISDPHRTDLLALMGEGFDLLALDQLTATARRRSRDRRR